MIAGRRSCGAVLLLLVASAPVYSQSLGDLARKEEARRGSAQKATRSFSDADLGPRVIALAEAPQACYVSVSEGRCLEADAIIANSQTGTASPETKRQEPMVRQEAAAIRAELSRLERELDQFAATAGDENLPEARRTAAAESLAQLQTLVERLKQRWVKLEKYVGQHQIPREWIAPVPEFDSRNPQ